MPQARSAPPALPPALGLRPEAPKAPSAALPATRPAPPPLPTPDPPVDLVERLVVAEPPLSTAQRVLVVAEGGTFRARLDGDGPNLGLTLKATRDGRAIVQALPAPSRARAAGIRIGDEVLGVDGAAFERGVGLRHVAARIKASSKKVLTLRRGFAPVDSEKLAAVLQRRGALSDDGAAALTGEVAEVCRRAALWDERGEVVSDFDDVSVDVVERRPALCCRVVDYDDETYAVWTLDGRSGAEWRVRRSFARFRDLRSVVKRLAPRHVSDDLDRTFPDEATFYDTVSSINERCRALETYLRRCLSLLLTGPLHNKAGRLHACLEDFLDVPARLASLELLERNPDAHLRRAAQVAAHQILATPSLDGVVSTIVEACRGKEGHDLLTAMATAIDGLQAALVEGCGPFFEAVVLRRTRRMTEEELDLLVRAAVRRQVEAEVFVPLSSVLDESLRGELAEEETALRESCAAARLKTQAALGCIESPSKWEAAVYRLATVGSYTLPCDRLDVLLAAAREVPVVFAAEHGGEEVLGGDDFLPIFVYVVVQAGIPDLRFLQTVLSALCDPDKRLSETGYYVATFEAAVEHVRALPLARVLGEENPFAP